MEETRTGGTKEFIFSVIWALFLLMLGRLIIFTLPNYKIIGVIITIMMFCLLAYFVLTRYSAVYTYTLKNDILRVNRRIGHRNKEVQIYMTEILSVSRAWPRNVKARASVMKTSAFSKKRTWYVVYERGGEKGVLEFEPSARMAEKIISRAKRAGE